MPVLGIAMLLSGLPKENNHRRGSILKSQAGFSCNCTWTFGLSGKSYNSRNHTPHPCWVLYSTLAWYSCKVLDDGISILQTPPLRTPEIIQTAEGLTLTWPGCGLTQVSSVPKWAFLSTKWHCHQGKSIGIEQKTLNTQFHFLSTELLLAPHCTTVWMPVSSYKCTQKQAGR